MADHRRGPRPMGICPSCGELRHLRLGGRMGEHKRMIRKHYRSSNPCAGVDHPARLYGPEPDPQMRVADPGGTKIMTDQPAPHGSPEAAPTPVMYPRRAVMHVAMPILHDLLDLPDDVEVLHVAPGRHGLTLAVVLTSPDVPPVPPECAPWEITPTYERAAEGRARLVSTGIDQLKGGK